MSRTSFKPTANAWPDIARTDSRGELAARESLHNPTLNTAPRQMKAADVAMREDEVGKDRLIHKEHCIYRQKRAAEHTLLKESQCTGIAASATGIHSMR